MNTDQIFFLPSRINPISFWLNWQSTDQTFSLADLLRTEADNSIENSELCGSLQHRAQATSRGCHAVVTPLIKGARFQARVDERCIADSTGSGFDVIGTASNCTSDFFSNVCLVKKFKTSQLRATFRTSGFQWLAVSVACGGSSVLGAELSDRLTSGMLCSARFVWLHQ